MKLTIVAVTFLATQWFLAPVPAATVNVINSNDNLAGSLRQAIQDANSGDTIKFAIPPTDPGYDSGSGITTINLTSAELTIGRNLTIDGSGAKGVVRSGNGDVRIFNVTEGAVIISTLTIANGSPASGGGGGILNAGNLTVSRCTLMTNGVGSQDGGGISNSGTLTVTDSTLSQNDGNRGSAIYNTGTLTVVGSTIRGNLAGISNLGGGIWNSGSTARVQNSVVAGNNVGSSEMDVFGDFISDGYNFIGATDSSNGFGEAGSHDQVGTSAAPADPGLGDLRDNGGPTFTEIPNAGSPLVDQGSSSGQAIDQVGLPRVIDDPAVANAGGGDGSDIGAAERDLRQIGSPYFLVNSLDERSDGVCGENDCTLIEALDIANTAGDIDCVLFKAGLTGTITTNRLTPSGLTITGPVTISGPGARQLTISGNHAGRVFQVLSGSVVIAGLTIADGVYSGTGGAIYVNGGLTLQDCTVTGNAATGAGGSAGGLYVAPSDVLVMRNCTITGNTAVVNGGGVVNNGGTFTAIDSTFYNNQSFSGFGGAVCSFDGVSGLVGCTVTLNTGYGLENASGTFQLSNSLVAWNSADNSNAPDLVGSFTSAFHNLVGISDGSNGLTNGVNHDLVGTVAEPLDPGLDSFNLLQNNGGPTDTIALLEGSIAIDAANPVGSSVGDQRHFDRVGAPDIGAFEFGGTIPMTLANISTRLSVETGDNVLIGGFIVTGTHDKQVLLRAIGPSLMLPGKLANPMLELHDGTGAIIATNDDWQTNANKQEIIDTTIAPTNALESALLMTLNPGAYTGIVRGVNNGTGIALIEAYDLDRTVDSKLANISTRGLVQTGDDVMIGGFIVLGSLNQNVIVRAIGPSLPVTGKLADPVLELHNRDGSILASNDNWRETQEDEIIATGIPPTDDAESAIVATLAPGAYTAIVSGVDGTTGVALAEIFGLQ